ncbi:MAG: hypoxanthine phosphoribosyltransferase [Christensenellales bacterium]|jgi:hypoxanthine phosphoribosyltransferase
MKNDMARVLLTEDQIQARVRELSKQITEDYREKDPVLICILNGAVMFYADLVRNIGTHIAMDFMAVSSYGNSTKSSGEVEIRKDLSKPVDGRHVIIVEDIVDSGFTLTYLTRLLRSRGTRSIEICTLLDKPTRRAPGIRLDIRYTGFEIENEFVVGYGLDYAERYRNLPFIGVLKPEIYES